MTHGFDTSLRVAHEVAAILATSQCEMLFSDV